MFDRKCYKLRNVYCTCYTRTVKVEVEIYSEIRIQPVGMVMELTLRGKVMVLSKLMLTC